MSMSDPIADLITRIRNALTAGHDRVDVPASRIKREICSVLKNEGYIEDFTLAEGNVQGIIQIRLKYLPDRKPVLQGMKRVSRPSLREYVRVGDLQNVRSGLGIAIVSTSRGVMTTKQARQEKVGGEILCEIW